MQQLLTQLFVKRLTLSCEKFLESIGRLKAGQLGGNEIKPIDEKDKKIFTDILTTQLSNNNRIIWVAIVLLCVLFGVGVSLVFYYLDSPKIMGVVFGGTFLSLLSIIEWLHRLWTDKSKMDLLYAMTPELSSEQFVKLAEIIYWKDKDKDKK